jgi:hypothetical protein
LGASQRPSNPLQNDIDADGDELTITAITQPGNGDSATIAADGQSIHYNPAGGAR